MTTREYFTLVVLLMAILGNTWLIVGLVVRQNRQLGQKCIRCGIRPAVSYRVGLGPGSTPIGTRPDALPQLCGDCLR